MEITLLPFQFDAIQCLLEEMETPNRDIILKSCTGSGKTIILTHFMYEYRNYSVAIRSKGKE
jgi:type III restriction enzyme